MPTEQKSQAQWDTLWQQYKASGQAVLRDQLIEHYLPLVLLVAGRLAISLPTYVDRDDLISNGFFGLLDAIERFDMQRGIKFETYASLRIRGAILDALRAQDWAPATLRHKARQYELAVQQVEHRLGRNASEEEVAQELGISAAQLQTLLQQLSVSTLLPLEEALQQEKQGKENNLSARIEIEEVQQMLAEAIEKLPEKEKIVVSLYYYDRLTLKEISLILKLSEARISQIHTKAIFRLRGVLQSLRESLL